MDNTPEPQTQSLESSYLDAHGADGSGGAESGVVSWGGRASDSLGRDGRDSSPWALNSGFVKMTHILASAASGFPNSAIA